MTKPFRDRYKMTCYPSLASTRTGKYPQYIPQNLRMRALHTEYRSHQLRDRALRFAHARNRRFEHIEGFVHLLVGHHERHQHADHIRVRACRDCDQSVLITESRDLLGFVRAGVFPCCESTSSMACIPPKPRTSPIIEKRRCHSHALLWKRSPNSLARASRLSRSNSSSTASAAAHDSGFPPNVPPRPPTTGASMISARPVTAASGSPPARDFAETRMSGSIPYRSLANKTPVRPNPDCTSSAMKRMPYLWQSSTTTLK